MLETRQAVPVSCPGCGTEFASHFLVCPDCHRLVHADALRRLADEAGAAEASGDVTAALGAWRSALELLPGGSKQHGAIAAKVAELGKLVDASPGARPAKAEGAEGWGGRAAGLGTVALMVLSKGKLLLLGLTKISTLFSMFLTASVVLVALGLEVRRRAGRHDLHPRDGPRRRPVALRDQGRRPDVHPRHRGDRSGARQRLVEPSGGSPGRPGRADLGGWARSSACFGLYGRDRRSHVRRPSPGWPRSSTCST